MNATNYIEVLIAVIFFSFIFTRLHTVHCFELLSPNFFTSFIPLLAYSIEVVCTLWTLISKPMLVLPHLTHSHSRSDELFSICVNIACNMWIVCIQVMKDDGTLSSTLKVTQEGVFPLTLGVTFIYNMSSYFLQGVAY